MSNKPKITAAERQLFRDAIKGVRRIKSDKILQKRNRPAPLPYQLWQDEAQARDDMFSDDWDIAHIETGEELLFSREGIQQNLLRKLRRGHFSVGAELDLHGQTVAEARVSLTEFLHHCRDANIRTVRIVHGKGHGSRNKLPVLKNKVNHWLQQRDEVLAFCSARQVDGGTGAVYVLLKRKR
jgi:DNA-nicking Smr family endonuclease